MAKAKKIPWMGKLRQIARAYSRLGERGRHSWGPELVSKYHVNFQRLMDAADFSGVKWNVEFYIDDGRKASKMWRLTIDAGFEDNDTRWMRAIKAMCELATAKMGCWHRDMRFRTKFGEVDVIEINVSEERVQIVFRDRNRVKPYCKTHRVRDIDADRKYREYRYTTLYVQRQSLSLETVLGTIKKWM